MARQIIDELLNKARSYPKVEGYLRGLDKKRIDEGEDVPVTKRETAVRTADENAAKRLESQGKSMNEDLVKSIDALMEKAVYGVGAVGGKPVKSTGNVRKKTGKVTHPQLSKEQQERILQTSKEKAARGLATAGQHKEAEKVRGQVNTVKSLDDRTADLAKSLYDVVNHRRFSKMDPDAGWDKIKEQRMDRDASKLKESIDADEKRLGEGNAGPMKKKKKSLDSDLEKAKVDKLVDQFKFKGDKGHETNDAVKRAFRRDRDRTPGDDLAEPITQNRIHEFEKPIKRHISGPKGDLPKSLDERTSDLHKGFDPQKVGGAVGREYVKNPDSEKAKRVAVKFHSKNRGDSAAQHKYNEGMTNEVWAHNLKLAKKSQQDVMNTWQTDSAFITKGARVEVQGGKPATLVKDENEDEGAE